MIKCLICEQVFEKQILFTNHLKKDHNMTYKNYYDSYIKNENEGKCLFCGKDTKFERGKYRDYCCVSCMRQSSIIQNRIKQTCIDKYGGVGLASQRIKNKAEQTNIEKYGVRNPYMSEQTKEKAHSTEALKKYKQTMMSKYGVESPMQLDANKQKMVQVTHTSNANKKRMNSIKKSNLELFGVEHNFQREDVKQSIKNSRIRKQLDFCAEYDCTPLTELIAKYGTGWCQSNLQIDSVYNGNARYIKNYEIDKIKKYVESNVKSHDEDSIFQYITSIYNEKILQHDRKIIAPYELDIYIPDKKVAIEYNGLYWHSVNVGVDKNYHLMKTQLCEEKGIRLIHIFQNEWNEHQDICKSIIASALGIYENRIYARKCDVKLVDNSEAKDFLDSNHIQGYVSAKYNLGLYYHNELVQLISIGKSRYKKGEYELLRMCSKLYTQVIGGFSKLMNNQPYKRIYSYIDRSKFSGVGYYNSNFILEAYTKPSYFYWSYSSGKLNRLVCQKHKLSKLLGSSFYNNKTEQQNMIDAGYLLIYDCGNIKVKYQK